MRSWKGHEKRCREEVNGVGKQAQLGWAIRAYAH